MSNHLIKNYKTNFVKKVYISLTPVGIFLIFINIDS